MKKIISLVSLMLCTLAIPIIYFIKQNNNKYIAVYLDNIESTSIPDRNFNYIIDKIVCDNDAIGTWDNVNWSLLVTNLSKRSNCKLYFQSKKDITITYDNNYIRNNIFEEKFNSESLSTSSNCANNTYLTHNISYINGYKKYTFQADTADCVRDGIFLNNKNALEENTIYHYSFEAKASENFSIYVGPEQNGQKTYSVNLNWQKYSTTFTSKNISWRVAFTFYFWMPSSGTRTLEVKNIALQEGEYDNFSTTILKEYDNLNNTLPTPTRENYTFLGWYTDPIEGEKISSETIVAEDTTYYAHWQYNESE